MHHCHSFSRFSRPYRPVIIDMHSPRGSWRCSLCCWCVSLAFARVGQPIAWSLGTSDGASRSLGKMSSSSNSVADCSSWPDARYARARCHLIPSCNSCAIIDVDVIQFAADTLTAATSAPAPDPCRSLAPTRQRKTSAPHPSAGGHLRQLTSCAGTSTLGPLWTSCPPASALRPAQL